jgi:hypothetical protein
VTIVKSEHFDAFAVINFDFFLIDVVFGVKLFVFFTQGAVAGFNNDVLVYTNAFDFREFRLIY